MNYQVVSKENNTVKMSITVPAAEFEKSVQKAYLKSRGRFNMPGFRKGKAPRKIIEMTYGEGVFFEEAIDLILPEAYRNALDELKIEPVARPDIDIKELAKGKDVVFEADVVVKPEVSLGDYKGLEVEKVTVDVTDEQVTAELDKQRDMNGRVVDVEDRPVADGDTAIIDFEGFVDGQAFEGGKGENHNLVIGSGSFIPGFEEQLIGADLNADKEVNVTFPEDYHADHLAGKEAVFKVAIKGIKVKELPALDDEFAKDTSEFDTLDELKADIKESLQKSATEQAESATRDKVIDAVVEKLEADIPAEMIEGEIDGMVQDFEYQLRYQGLELDQYLQFSGSKMEDLREQMKEDAEGRVKVQLTLEKVAQQESIEVTDEDLEKEFERLAESQKSSVEDVKKMFGAQTEYMKASIQTRKTVDFLVDNANLK